MTATLAGAMTALPMALSTLCMRLGRPPGWMALCRLCCALWQSEGSTCSLNLSIKVDCNDA